jgi:endoglucanase
MAYAITVLSWGVIDYEEAYVKAGELENVHKAIKWGTDYFLKVFFFIENLIS